MAMFETHLNSAVILSGVLAIPLFNSGILDANQTFGALAFGVVGGILPDIDAKSSKPVLMFFKIFSVFFPLVFLIIFAKNFSLIEMFLLWIVAWIGLEVLFRVFFAFTVHRGIFHTIGMGVLFAQIVILVFDYYFDYDRQISFIFGFFLFFGFLLHLILDEISSFKISHILTHSSALKFYSKNNILGSIVLYVLIFILGYFLPLKSYYFSDIFNTLARIKIW